jgi:hypothetical protein
VLTTTPLVFLGGGGTTARFRSSLLSYCENLDFGSSVSIARYTSWEWQLLVVRVAESFSECTRGTLRVTTLSWTRCKLHGPSAAKIIAHLRVLLLLRTLFGFFPRPLVLFNPWQSLNVAGISKQFLHDNWFSPTNEIYTATEAFETKLLLFSKQVKKINL